MSKKETKDVALAATDALAEQLLTLQSELDVEREIRKELEYQVEKLRAKLSDVTNSVQVAPPPPAPKERPVITLEDGTRLRFKAGSFKTGGKVYLSADVAKDAELLKNTVAKFPGLFEPA